MGVTALVLGVGIANTAGRGTEEVASSGTAPDSAPASASAARRDPGTGTRTRARSGAGPRTCTRAGDPGWQQKFDRDGDGVGCES